jgi:hypothetical protein
MKAIYLAQLVKEGYFDPAGTARWRSNLAILIQGHL